MDRADKLIDFLDSISNQAFFLEDDREEKIKTSLNHLKGLLQNRIDYSVLTGNVLSFDESLSELSEHMEIIELNIYELIHEIERNNLKDKNDLIRILYKIKDHLKLSLIQRNFSEALPERILKNELAEIKVAHKAMERDNALLLEQIDDLNDKKQHLQNEIETSKSSIYTSIITILGIFTAITFGIFGGMEILRNVLNDISAVRMSKLLIFSSLIIGAILTILYMLLIGIANLTKLPIRNCGCHQSDSCTHTLFQKHPVYLTGMMASLYLFLIGIIAHEYDGTNLRGVPYFSKFMEDGYSLIVLAVLLLIILLIIFYSINTMIQKRKSDK